MDHSKKLDIDSTACTPPQLFFSEPRLNATQPGFQFVIDLMRNNERFAYCKLNHGFWERLVLGEAHGFFVEDMPHISGERFDIACGIVGIDFATGGFLTELLAAIRTSPGPDVGMHFIPSLSPWPHSDQIEGTPYESHAHCTAIIEKVVPEYHLRNVKTVGFTGHDFKSAAITGDLRHFLAQLSHRDVIFLGNPDNRTLLDALSLTNITFIEADPRNARKQRLKIREQLFTALEDAQTNKEPPLVLSAIGGALSCWLAFAAWEQIFRFQFIDLGGVPAAYSPYTALRANWTKAYQCQLTRSLTKLPVSLPATALIYGGNYGLRSPELIEISLDAGVARPASCGEMGTPMPTINDQIPFLENKPYDHQRISELLTLSLMHNHHANGGPVVRLLEQVVHRLLNSPQNRRVIAVNSGTSALHLAAGLAAYRANKPNFRWITSAFNFYSCNVGPLAGATILDCDETGQLDLEKLRNVPLDSYDGVIFTNVFTQNSNWKQAYDYCQTNKKAFIVDNATGLLDRPDPQTGILAIEAISCHHTKPWGVGEAGLILCDAEDEESLRHLSNFGVQLPGSPHYFASNYKLSDLAAAALIDRLERMNHWGKFYAWQGRRMHSLIIDAALPVQAWPGSSIPVISPRAHTPFLCDHPVDIFSAAGRMVLRKYYRPLRQSDGQGEPTPYADDIFSRCFSISNQPAMRLIPNNEIINQLHRLCAGP